MALETYNAKLKHDNGTVMLRVVSLSGKHGAIQHITAVEGCPECAIVEIVKIDNKTIRYERRNGRRSQKYG